jgi:hypothetical protein
MMEPGYNYDGWMLTSYRRVSGSIQVISSEVRGGRSDTGAGFPWLSPFSLLRITIPPYSMFTYHHPLSYEAVLARQHIITFWVFKWGGAHLWPHTAGYQIINLSCLLHYSRDRVGIYGKKAEWRPKRRWKNNIKTDIEYYGILWP